MRVLLAFGPRADLYSGKDKKKVDKHVAQNAAASQEAAAVTDAEVRAALEKVRSETVPASPQEKEGYFMTQVNLGEQLCGQGESQRYCVLLSC